MLRTSAEDSCSTPLGGMRTVSTGARRPLSVTYFSTTITATAATTSAMMATRSRIRHTELATGVCSSNHSSHTVVRRVIVAAQGMYSVRRRWGEGHAQIERSATCS